MRDEVINDMDSTKPHSQDEAFKKRSKINQIFDKKVALNRSLIFYNLRDSVKTSNDSAV